MTSQAPDPSTPENRPTAPQPEMPDYRGAPLDPDRGPGLGCFWAQVIVLAALLVITPLTVIMAMEPWISAVLLGLTLLLLLFVGQTTIFLLRLVAVDRRTRRRPLSASARKTVGQLEDEQPVDRQGKPRPAAEPGTAAEPRDSDEDHARSR